MKITFRKNTGLLMLAFAMLFSVNLVQAQPGGQQGGQQGPPPIPDDEQIEQMVSDLATELTLNETQEKEVSEIYFAHFDEVEAKMKSGRPERSEMENLKTSFQKEVKAVLTKDQQKQYEAYIKTLESQRGRQRPQGK